MTSGSHRNEGRYEYGGEGLGSQVADQHDDSSSSESRESEI